MKYRPCFKHRQIKNDSKFNLNYSKKMTSIFIPSMMGDTDSILVKVALEQNGHHVIRLVGDNYPRSQVSTFHVSNVSGISGGIKDNKLKLYYDNVDVVWLRRPRWPVLPNYVDERDAGIAEQDCRNYIRYLYQAAWHEAFWINSLDGRRKANSKLLQLKEAVKIGMAIPTTIVSNDPIEIKEFIDRNRDQVIVKALGGGEWTEDGLRHVTFTAIVDSDDLPTDRFIQACPCIYQKKIEKQYEVRLVFFGVEAVAVKLDSQKDKMTSVDWRVGGAKDLNLQHIQVPEHTYIQCLKLMQKLNIVHGSFDFAVDLENNWVFFEVNEAGQFLWIEGKHPDIPMLNIATQFFATPSWNFKFNPKNQRASIYEISTSEKYAELVNEDKMNNFSAEQTATV